jgi:hypothetical protein
MPSQLNIANRCKCDKTAVSQQHQQQHFRLTNRAQNQPFAIAEIATEGSAMACQICQCRRHCRHKLFSFDLLTFNTADTDDYDDISDKLGFFYLGTLGDLFLCLLCISEVKCVCIFSVFFAVKNELQRQRLQTLKMHGGYSRANRHTCVNSADRSLTSAM